VPRHGRWCSLTSAVSGVSASVYPDVTEPVIRNDGSQWGGPVTDGPPAEVESHGRLRRAPETGPETEGHALRKSLTEAPDEVPKASDVEGHANQIGSNSPDEAGAEVEGHANKIRPSSPD